MPDLYHNCVEQRREMSECRRKVSLHILALLLINLMMGYKIKKRNNLSQIQEDSFYNNGVKDNSLERCIIRIDRTSFKE